jgi:hypothetical protein
MEAIGDITASAEVSRLPVDGEDFDSRIQGGVLVCLDLQALTRVNLINYISRVMELAVSCLPYSL